MSRDARWLGRERRAGRLLAVAGALVCVAGVMLEAFGKNLPFDARLVTALGILLAGMAIGRLVRSGLLARDPAAAQRVRVQEGDERSLALRHRAGTRAYYTSAAITYALLMWTSFAHNGQLPALSADALWYALAAAVIVPWGAYIASLIYDQSHM